MANRADEEQLSLLEAQNAELRQVVTVLVARADEVFASRAWKLGRVMARIERPFRKLLLGDRRPYRHLEPGYFHRPAQRALGFMRQPPVGELALPRSGAGAADVQSGGTPTGYARTSVAAALYSLWASIAEGRRHGG